LHDDFEGWRAALRGKPEATLRVYPGLDHRFVAGTGPSSPADYAEPAHVDVRVIEDIGAFIAAVAPRARAATSHSTGAAGNK
jgi:hypothetical protein